MSAVYSFVLSLACCLLAIQLFNTNGRGFDTGYTAEQRAGMDDLVREINGQR